MQATITFSRKGLAELAKFLFDSGEPVVSQAYSDYGRPLRRFRTASELIADFELEVANGQQFLNYVLHYPDTKGYVAKRKITLNAKSCDGHTWRYTVEGWGLIQLQADLKRAPAIECRVAVNSQKRAEAWVDTYPDFRDPGLWDWRAVQRHAGRIIRRMKKIAESQCDPL
jgi:hypothetical protein